MKITIHHQILSGNLGDGWNDQNKAADALAAFTEKRWAWNLAPYRDDGHDVEIDIDVQKDTIGSGRETFVDVDGDDAEAAFELKSEVEETMIESQKIWEYFCDSEEAKGL